MYVSLVLFCTDGLEVSPIMTQVTAPTPMLQRRTLQKQISISPPPGQIGSRYASIYKVTGLK